MIRLLDIILSGLALLALSPLLIPVCLVLRFTGEREVFYLQERVGAKGLPFNIYKFATMLKASPSLGPGTVTVRDDPRVLPFGTFLRKTKINELPQLLNIFFGHMSVIGPRPVTSREYGTYSSESRAAIETVMPGLSGMGSVIFRDEEALMALDSDPRVVYEKYIGPYKGRVEQWYAAKIGVGLYLLLIFLTVYVVLFSKSDLVWKVFPDLPVPPLEIQKALNYADA
ncbi:MAG: lipopolysaccharide/colanic/teichoic acid biosynthesis glycosyltransferase [Candidatus Azotimanducaceae bacterium]|jgi:lipopolysaccharide/colanic/teichoic acid biosynthesis glycosyltransferase